MGIRCRAISVEYVPRAGRAYWRVQVAQPGRGLQPIKTASSAPCVRSSAHMFVSLHDAGSGELTGDQRRSMFSIEASTLEDCPLATAIASNVVRAVCGTRAIEVLDAAVMYVCMNEVDVRTWSLGYMYMQDAGLSSRAPPPCQDTPLVGRNSDKGEVECFCSRQADGLVPRA